MDNWGPSFWTTLHIIAYQTKKNINGFIPLVKQIVEKLPCESCVKDGLIYIKNHPLKKIALLPNGDDISPFVWMCDFHNYVNRKLNKPEITWTDAYERFHNQSCDHCGLPTKTSQSNQFIPTFNHSINLDKANNSDQSEKSSISAGLSQPIQEYEIRFVSSKNNQLSQKLNAQIKQ